MGVCLGLCVNGLLIESHSSREFVYAECVRTVRLSQQSNLPPHRTAHSNKDKC